MAGSLMKTIAPIGEMMDSLGKSERTYQEALLTLPELAHNLWQMGQEHELAHLRRDLLQAQKGTRWVRSARG
jgi:hypothetical protein